MNKKIYRINLRLSALDHERIFKCAHDAQLTVSEYIRRRSLLYDNDRPLIKTDIALLQRIYSDLRHAGGNLNQCAHQLNRNPSSTFLEQELEDALLAITNASDEVSSFIAEARNSI